MSAAAPKVDADHPWLGLSAFTYHYRDYFFGRSAEIKEIVQRVQDYPLTVLYGQAGYGKTSLLGAGLVPKLKEEGYNPLIIRLDYDATAPSLTNQVCGALDSAVSCEREYRSVEVSTFMSFDQHQVFQKNHAEALEQEGLYCRSNAYDGSTFPTLWEYVKNHVTKLEDFKPVIILDQFEEIFTLGEAARRVEVREFFVQLADLIENRPPAALEERFRDEPALARQFDFGPSPLRVVLTLREDYLAHLEAWKKTMPALMLNRMALKLLSGPQALEAVVKPGRIDGRNLVSDEVGAQIVRFVAKRETDTPLSEIEAVPPLLSLLCDELNMARLNHKSEPLAQITAQLVTEQSADILQHFYTRCFAGYPDALRHFVEDRLLTSGGHRIPVAREDAEKELREHGISALAIDALIQGRLLTQEERGNLQRLEIVHDKISELAALSRDQRRDREAKESAERAEREARRREETARAEQDKLRQLMKKLEDALFDAVCANAILHARDDEDEKVVEVLAPYLQRAELESHCKRKDAQRLFERAKQHIQINQVAHDAFLARAKQVTLYLGKDALLELVLIPAGSLLMGSPESEKERGDDEKQHPVTISQPFYIGKFPVTQAQYESVIGRNPSCFKGPHNPVDTISWNDAVEFCEALDSKFKTTRPPEMKLQLPTEAQWEYACRASTNTRFYSGDEDADLDRVGWCRINSENKTHSVGQKQPNAVGLYDMHGNVWEWCLDANIRNYENLGTIDPFNLRGGYRVLRGGSWGSYAKCCRSAARDGGPAGLRNDDLGFRVVMALPSI